MKKTVLISIIALAIGAGAAYATEAQKAVKKATEAMSDCGDCPMHKKAEKAGAKKCANKMCPEAMEGVETVAKNTATGIEITMTARNEETIAKLQELTLVHYSNKETMEKDCPSRVEGAESKIENTPTGVKVILTGKTPEAVKKIQAASAKEHSTAGCPEESKTAAASSKHACPEEHGKKVAKVSKKYACPMKCAESDKPGKCPKCGMNMTEKK